MQKMRDLYEQSLAEYDSDEVREYRTKLNEMTQRVEDAWRVLVEERVSGVVEGFAAERRQRMQEMGTLQKQVHHLTSQLQNQQAFLSDLYKNQEFQQSFLSLQEHILKGKPLQQDIDRLVALVGVIEP